MNFHILLEKKYLMKKSVFAIAFVTMILCFSSCNSFKVHPYVDKIDGEKDINIHNINKIEANCHDKDTIRFAVISDSHVKYDDLLDAIHIINHSDFDFVLHLGDQTDYGLIDEFLDTREIMQKCEKPHIMILGNHDCVGSGKHIYKEIYGNPDFSFTVGPVKFVCLNTNSTEFHGNDNVPDLSYIEQEASNNNGKKIVVVMHVEPWDDAFDASKKYVFEQKIKTLGESVTCLYGHVHSYPSYTDYFDDGVVYYHCPKIADRYYLVFKIYNDVIDYEAIKF